MVSLKVQSWVSYCSPYRLQVSLEFLHCTPVGSKPGSYMPNMAAPDLNKI